MSSGKLILLLIAILMIGLVLLLGYKLDKYEEKGKRKEKIGKKQVNKENENFYTNFKSLKNDYENEMNQTTSFGNSSFDRIISKNDKYTEEFDKTAVIEKIDLSKLEMTEDVEVKSNEKVYEESEIENDLEEFEEEMNDEFENDDAYDYEKLNSSTMVFDTTNVNEKLISNDELVSIVKGYDFEESEMSKEEKPKTARKTVAKKTTTKKTTTKKTETKPKTTRKSTTKKVEEKPKTVRKTATKKTTTKKAEEKPKTTRKATAKKTDEKENKTKTAAKTATTKKAVKSTKTNEKK